MRRSRSASSNSPITTKPRSSNESRRHSSITTDSNTSLLVVVIGGTSGIGLACADRAIKSGNRVVIVGHDRDRGRAAESSLGDAAKFVQVDLSHGSEELNELVDVVKGTGLISCLFLCAGIGPKEPLNARTKDKRVDRVLMVNYLSHVLILQRLMPLLHPNLARILFCVGPQSHYCASPPVFDLSVELRSEERYAASKTACYCAAVELARQFPDVMFALFVPLPVRTGFHPAFLPEEAFLATLPNIASSWSRVALNISLGTKTDRGLPIVWRATPNGGGEALDLMMQGTSLVFGRNVVVTKEEQAALVAASLAFAPPTFQISPIVSPPPSDVVKSITPENHQHSSNERQCIIS